MAGERILVVDDEKDLALSCQRLLNRTGYETHTVHRAEEALVYMPDFNPHLVITDCKMPGMGGMELLRRVKGQYPGVGVVVMTGYSTVEEADEVQQWGADLMLKPFSVACLLQVVGKALMAGAAASAF